MRSPTRGKSSSSAGAIYLDRLARLEELRQMARRAAARVPTIRRAILFGSLVSGIPTPRSDADILVEVSESRHSRPQDRLPEILRAMTPLPCPVDLFVLTSQEIIELGREESPLVREALAQGEDLL